MFDIAYVYNMY